MSASLTAEAGPATRIVVDRPWTPLNGPWRFRVGDDPDWGEPGFDDSLWETVDLTPEPGAHDADVGLTSYSPGWMGRGHPDYAGYAWYRTRIVVEARPGVEIAMLAPAFVEDAYQIFWNGRVIGGSGDFRGETPAVYSTKPQVLHPPASVPSAKEAVIAVRVWMRPGMEREPDAGGIHIAPVLGERGAIESRYQVQWLETIKGYVVDVVEPAAFLLLAALAWDLAGFERSRRFHAWLCVALLLTAALRANQAVYFWTPWESLSTFLVVKQLVLEPLGLAAWAMTWRIWFQVERPKWLSQAILIVTILTMTFVLAGETLAMGRTLLRASMAAILLVIGVAGIRSRLPDRGLGLAAMLLVATGQFKDELWTLGVPNTWFPFGVGVSRTQYAYAALVVVLAGLLMRRARHVWEQQPTARANGALTDPGGARAAVHSLPSTR